jgi:hypothetical protein
VDCYPSYYYDILRPNIGCTLDNMYRMEEYLFRYAQDIYFTIVRPPPLSYEPLRSKHLFLKKLDDFWIFNNNNFKIYLDRRVVVEENGYNFPGRKIKGDMPRSELAQFMIEELELGHYVKRGVAVAIPYP